METCGRSTTPTWQTGKVSQGWEAISTLSTYWTSKTGAMFTVPVKTLAYGDTRWGLKQWKGARKVHQAYADNFKSYEEACKHLDILYEPSVPGIHHSNARIERLNQTIQSGAAALQHQAGLPDCFWNYSQPTYCFTENIAIDPETGYSKYYQMYGYEFEGESIPFLVAEFGLYQHRQNMACQSQVTT